MVACSLSFAEQVSSTPIKRGGVYVDISAGTHYADYGVSAFAGIEVLKDLYLSADLLGFRIITDVKDSTSRLTSFYSLLSIGTFFPLLLTQNEKLANVLFITEFILNPTVEYYLWRNKYVGVTLSAGYKTDWFLFSPEHALYFKPHGGIGVDVFGVRVEASYAYVVTHTYDIKCGPRFYLKVGYAY